jgi:outer membrane protein assembly factor BamB
MDATNGHALWNVSLQGQIFFDSPPVASGGLVYIDGLESGGTTYAVSETTGAVAWTANTFDGSDGTVAVAGGVVYEAEACDQLSAFNATSGVLNWFHSGNCTGGGGTAPSVYSGLIWERDWASGNVIINTAGQSAGAFTAQYLPAFHNHVAFYTAANTVSAVDLTNNTLKWSFTGDGMICTSAVVAGAGGQVFAGSGSGNVYEIDEATGMQRSVSDAGSPVSCGSEKQAMSLATGHLFVPAGNSLVAY